MADVYVIGAANSPNRTRVPASVVSTMPVAGSSENPTPVTGPSPLPKIVTISPGAIVPDALLAALTTAFTTTLEGAAAIVRFTVMVWGLFEAPAAVTEIVPV